MPGFYVPRNINGCRRGLEGGALIRGHATVREVNRELSLTLPEGETWTGVYDEGYERFRALYPAIRPFS